MTSHVALRNFVVDLRRGGEKVLGVDSERRAVDLVVADGRRLVEHLAVRALDLDAHGWLSASGTTCATAAGLKPS